MFKKLSIVLGFCLIFMFGLNNIVYASNISNEELQLELVKNWKYAQKGHSFCK